MRHTGWCSARTVFMSQPAAVHSSVLSCYVPAADSRHSVECSICTLCLQQPLRYSTCTRFLCSSLRRGTRIGGCSSVLPSPWLFLFVNWCGSGTRAMVEPVSSEQNTSTGTLIPVGTAHRLINPSLSCYLYAVVHGTPDVQQPAPFTSETRQDSPDRRRPKRSSAADRRERAFCSWLCICMCRCRCWCWLVLVLVLSGAHLTQQKRRRVR